MPWLNKVLKRNASQEPVPQIYNPKTDDYEVLQGSDGSMYVKGHSKDVILQDLATAAGNGTQFDIVSSKTLTIEISGTSTSRTVIFEAAGPSGAFYAVQGVKLSDFSTATQTTGTGELWQFDITGLSSFRARIADVAGGNVSVKGKAVA